MADPVNNGIKCWRCKASDCGLFCCFFVVVVEVLVVETAFPVNLDVSGIIANSAS